MLGYVGTPDANDARDQDGWLRTGDIGWQDEDGYLYITGRLKNIIICGGFNVVPEEVEAALDADPAVVESVVVGVPDDRLGEIPVALVQTALTAVDVLEGVKPRLASYKRPRRVFVVSEFPRVPNGKVDRPRCRTLALELVANR
jgi:long-chain acyl-CoA synthetase